ncbi:MAG TPA: class I adenylate-forming enzyme family protein [Stellaceae bacterium]|nr:class I adenylate-forming enzyme family protein [Stellaceae bacterium]
MTASFIAFHAAERPEAAALIENGRSITYAEFSRDIGKFTQALREFDLSPGARIAIGCDNLHVHWLLRLACEQLRLVSASVLAPESLSALQSLEDFDLVFLDRPVDTSRMKRRQVVTSAWLETVLERADSGDGLRLLKGPEDPLRILRTSGTTGSPKRLLYPRRVHERSVARSMWFNGFTRRSRYLLVIPFTVGASYANATACLRSGATVVVEKRMSIAKAALSHGITHLALAPLHLKQILDDLPDDFAKPAELTIFSFGAAISGVLYEKGLARFATEICDMYGSNEAGYVSSTRFRSAPEIVFSSIWPGVQIEIVDDRDRPLPFGALGQIRVKTDCMVEGYLDDPEASQRMFKDGWFYAGDVGVLADAHRLQVLGRVDELLNIGWNKFSPVVLEGLVMKVADVGDVGVCSLPNTDGLEEVYVAVSGGRTDNEELVARLNDAFRPFELGRFHVVRAARIPRNENGKIRRDVLRKAVAAAAGRTE